MLRLEKRNRSLPVKEYLYEKTKKFVSFKENMRLLVRWFSERIRRRGQREGVKFSQGGLAAFDEIF